MAHHWARLYARHDYLTPGAAVAVERLAEAVASGRDGLVVDIACGKGTGAVEVARRGARVLGVDRYLPFLGDARRRVAGAGVEHRAAFVRGDGRRLPVRDGAAVGASCIGGPSIVGMRECFREMARVLQPGGAAVVSDIVWRAIPDAPLGSDWAWIAEIEQITREGFGAELEAAGLAVETIEILPSGAWEEYFAPMLDVAEDARQSGDDAFADEVEATVDLERRAAATWLDYAIFVARRPA